MRAIRQTQRNMKPISRKSDIINIPRLTRDIERGAIMGNGAMKR
jgi:hypothetical protein